jgi:hypothetical protein
MAWIRATFQVMKDNYPHRPLTGVLKTFMDHTPGTPCCVQVSHSLNLAGQTVDQRSYRRPNSPITVGGTRYFYLLAVDEMDRYLGSKYGPGEDLAHDAGGHRLLPAVIKANLVGRQGIMVFRDHGAGFHTELWDGRQILQRDMNEPALFTQPRVLFWDVGFAFHDYGDSPTAVA